MRIGTISNMSSFAYRTYSSHLQSFARSIQRISSGYRINSAADDAAGLAISEKMRAQITGIQTASKNAQDTVSLLQVADGAMQEAHAILQRMREIAVQSASDTNDPALDRNALNLEFQELIAELNDIAGTTVFNDMTLLDGSFSSNTTVANISNGAYASAWAPTSAAAGSYKVSYRQIETKAAVAGEAATGTLLEGASLSTNASGAGQISISFENAAQDERKDERLNGEWSVGYDADKQVYTAKNASTGEVRTAVAGSLGERTEIDFGNLGKLIVQVENGGTRPINVEDLMGLQAQINVEGGVTERESEKKDVAELNGEQVALEEGQKTISFANSGVSLQLKNGYRRGTDISGTVQVAKISGRDFVAQTGPNQGDQTSINLGKVDARALGVASAGVASRQDASAAITQVDRAIKQLATERATVGAKQNRLGFKISNLDNMAVNLAEAESRIRDVDIAKEMTNLLKSQLLMSSSSAMMAQANSMASSVLSLLQ